MSSTLEAAFGTDKKGECGNLFPLAGRLGEGNGGSRPRGRAICDYRRSQGIDGPRLCGERQTRYLLLGRTERAEGSRANNWIVLHTGNRITPSPVISRAVSFITAAQRSLAPLMEEQ